MADEIHRRLGISSHLVVGAGGAFEVRWGEDLIFSKMKSGRFPDPQEVFDALGSRLTSAGVCVEKE